MPNRGLLWLALAAMVMCAAFAPARTTISSAYATQAPTPPPVPDVLEGDYHVVFFGAEDASSGGGLVNAVGLAETFGAESASTWDRVMALNDARPIDALIIHRSVLAQVDPAWVGRNYRQGLVIAGLDINGIHMAELLEDDCLTRDGFAHYTSGSYFIIASSQMEGASDDIARILEARRQSCGAQAAEGIVGTASYRARRTTEFLTDARSVAIFYYLLSDHLADYAD